MPRFNIQGHLHRMKNGHHLFVWTRNYARIETAVRRCTEFLILEGEVGDIIEFTLKVNGYQVGTIRLKATGKMEVLWNDSEVKKVKNDSLLGSKAKQHQLPKFTH